MKSWALTHGDDAGLSDQIPSNRLISFKGSQPDRSRRRGRNVGVWERLWGSWCVPRCSWLQARTVKMTLGAKGSPRWQTSDDRDLHPTAAARDCCLPATWTRLQTDSSSSLKMSPPAWMTPAFHPCEIRNADLKDPQARALTNSIALSWSIRISL